MLLKTINMNKKLMFSMYLSSSRGDLANTAKYYRQSMPNEKFQMLWEFWGKVILGQRGKESLCGQCSVLILSPGMVLHGWMGTTFWGKGWYISWGP